MHATNMRGRQSRRLTGSLLRDMRAPPSLCDLSISWESWVFPFRVLVAGGSGFVGSHLVDALLASGAEVVVVDNYITGRPSNLEHLSGHDRLSIVEADAAVLDSVPGRFDAIYHLASPASPVAYQKYPLETLHAGSIVTEALLQRALHDDARIVLASTSEVYGDPLRHPQAEDYWGNVNPVGPRSMYDEAKRFAEAVTMAYIRNYTARAGIARIFNTYGPRMAHNDGRVIPAFIGAALDGRPIPLHGDGTQTRSLCYVSDLVRGLIALSESDAAGPINLGNPREESLKDLANRISTIVGADAGVEFFPRPGDDPERRQPDITQARKLLKWEPEVDIDDGLGRTIAWFRKSRT